MTKKALVHFAIEFMPSFGFFVAAQLYDFFTATAILMGLAVASLIIGWLLEKTLPTLPVILTVFEIVAGSLTIFYKAPDVLILSNTIYYGLFGITLLFGLIINKNVLKRILFQTFALTDRGWFLLARRWSILLLLLAVTNEYIRIMHTPDVWVDFKFYSMVVMTIFGAYQITLSRKYRIPESSNRLGIRTQDSSENTN